MIKALVELYVAIHALRLAFEEKASTTEILGHFDLVRMRLDAVIELSGRDQFVSEFRRWSRTLTAG